MAVSVNIKSLVMSKSMTSLVSNIGEVFDYTTILDTLFGDHISMLKKTKRNDRLCVDGIDKFSYLTDLVIMNSITGKINSIVCKNDIIILEDFDKYKVDTNIFDTDYIPNHFWYLFASTLRLKQEGCNHVDGSCKRVVFKDSYSYWKLFNDKQVSNIVSSFQCKYVAECMLKNYIGNTMPNLN